MILGIYGTGGLGREVLELAQIINKKSLRWENMYFISDFQEADEVNGVSVLSLEEFIQKATHPLEIIIAVGEPEARKKLYDSVKNKDIALATLIHPEVHVPLTTSVGEGCIIQMGCFLSTNVTICENVCIQPNVNIGHDNFIGMHSVLSGFSNLGGHVTIGNNTYIGLSSCIKQGIRIGFGTIIGMGSVVYNEIPDGVIALGNPARVMHSNAEKRVFK